MGVWGLSPHFMGSGEHEAQGGLVTAEAPRLVWSAQDLDGEPMPQSVVTVPG